MLDTNRPTIAGYTDERGVLLRCNRPDGALSAVCSTSILAVGVAGNTSPPPVRESLRMPRTQPEKPYGDNTKDETSDVGGVGYPAAGLVTHCAEIRKLNEEPDTDN